MIDVTLLVGMFYSGLRVFFWGGNTGDERQGFAFFTACRIPVLLDLAGFTGKRENYEFSTNRGVHPAANYMRSVLS